MFEGRFFLDSFLRCFIFEGEPVRLIGAYAVFSDADRRDDGNAAIVVSNYLGDVGIAGSFNSPSVD